MINHTMMRLPLVLEAWISYECASKLDNCFDEEKSRLIMKAILTGKAPFIGSWHQDERLKGAPLFSDGKVSCYSQRQWGKLVATALEPAAQNDMLYAFYAWDRGPDHIQGIQDKFDLKSDWDSFTIG